MHGAQFHLRHRRLGPDQVGFLSQCSLAREFRLEMAARGEKMKNEGLGEKKNEKEGKRGRGKRRQMA